MLSGTVDTSAACKHTETVAATGGRRQKQHKKRILKSNRSRRTGSGKS